MPDSPLEPEAREPGTSPPEARPRPDARRWLRPAVVRLVLMLVVFAGVDALANLVVGAVAGAPFWCLVLGVAAAVLALWLYAGAVRFTERRGAVELRPRDARRGLLRGAGLGLLLFTVVVAVIAVFGGYRIAGWGSFGGAAATLGLMCAASVAEELMFRGVALRILEELTGTRAALVVSAVVFGGLHLVNPGATVWGALAVAVEGGLMLGTAYVATRSLWLPIGVHLAWNFAESGIYGTAVSGSGPAQQGLLHAVVSGPSALTGGAFGPEASLVALAACAVPTVLFYRAALRRGRVHRRGYLRVKAR
jgi:hypothetical protein